MGIGQFFNWGTDDTPAAPSSPAAADAGNVPDAAIAAARAKVADAVQTRKKGRTSADTGSIERDNAIIQAEIQRQLESCYDPKAWGALLALPADATLAITGRDNWKISRDERDTLGAAGSAAARTMMIQNPRSLAFLMLASALFSVYVPRAIQEFQHQAEKRKQDAEKNRIKGA